MRTGVLIGVSSLAASFLGREAFGGDPSPALVILALAAFALSVAASVYVLLPKKDQFIFATAGSRIYEELYPFREDMQEVYRRLAYDLDRFWDANDKPLTKIRWGYRLATAALVAEISLLIALVSGDIF